MEFKWFMVMMAIGVAGICVVGTMGAYTDGQVKVAHEQTLSKCYDAAKTNPNIKCEQPK